MAILHASFLLDAEAFERELGKVVAPAGSLSSARLLGLALEAFHHRTPDSKEFIRLVCLDEQEQMEDDDFHQATRWFLMALSSHLQSHTSLGNHSFAALQLILPELDWSAEDCQLLLCGRRLEALPRSYGRTELANNLHSSTISASWLPLEDIHHLTTKLQSLPSILETRSPDLIPLLDKLDRDFLGGRNPATIIRKAVEEISRRLTTAQAANRSLILTNDARSYTSDRSFRPL